MLLVHSYTEYNAPSLARALVAELRGEPYKLKAYVWNYGEEEQKQELERIRKEVERQKAMIQQARLAVGPDAEFAPIPIRVPKMLVRVQCAVLIGGYRDMEAARHDLEQRIKKLPPLDGKRFQLPEMFMSTGKGMELAHLNPFLKAFPVMNPTHEKEKVARDTVDFATLQRLNAHEEFSLLKCPRSWTLAVKQFTAATQLQHRGPSAGLLQAAGGSSGGQKDASADNAHLMAMLLRRWGWEAWVLHTPYYSAVTVGSYDGKDDGRIPRDQQELAKPNERLMRIDPWLQFSAAQPIPVPRPLPPQQASR
jgi:hypothetical protein